MRTTKIAFVLAAAVLLLGTSGAAIAAQAARRTDPFSTTVKELLARLDEAVRKESETGCVEDDEHGERRFCGASKEKAEKLHDDTMRSIDELRARPAEARAKAHAVIRNFRGDAKLPLTYTSTSSDPYRDGDGLIESYVDDNGNEYWINPQNDVLIQVGPNAGAHKAARPSRPDARLSVKELRAKAVSLIEANVTGFAEKRSSLHPLEDNKKGEIYFFRWDDFSAPVKESEMPPFVQAGLYADGSIASYTNTLTR
jgi:hypothetical protein